MMTEQEFKRRVKVITKALQTNNLRSLSIKDCQWLLNNYWLRPQQYWDLMHDFRRHTRKEFELFYTTFDLMEWIISEIDLNHALTWILHWIERKQTTNENVKRALEDFKQRCLLVHTVRNAIGLKTYNIHYIYSTHVYKPRDSFNTYNKFQKLVTQMYGRSAQEVVTKFLAQMRPSEKDMRRFKIKRVNEVADKAIYYIKRDSRMSDDVLRFLTDGSTRLDVNTNIV